MTIDAITLGGAFMPQLFPLPDSSGLKPLVLPDVILSNPSSSNDEPPSRSVPSPDAVDRFQKAISTPIPSISRLVATIAAAPQQQQAPAPQASRDISAGQPIVVEPRPTIVEPPIAVVEPKTTIVEPQVAVVEPQVAVVEPKVAVVEPQTTIVEPKTTIVEPKIAIAEPQAATVRPQATQITKPENADLPSVTQGPKVENVPNGVFSANSPAPAIKIPEPTKAEGQATGNELRALDSGLQLQTPENKSPGLVAKATPSPEHADLSAVKVQDPKIETVENRPSIAEPATLQADKPIQVAEDKPVQATDRPIQVVADKPVQTADKSVRVAEGKQASAIERQTVNVDRQPAAIERQTATVERKNPNVEIQIDLAESPKTDGVVICAVGRAEARHRDRPFGGNGAHKRTDRGGIGRGEDNKRNACAIARRRRGRHPPQSDSA